MARVLFWSESFWPAIGGVEVFGLNLLLSVRARGHEFAVITNQHRPELPTQDHYQGIPVYRFPFLAALEARNVDQIVTIRQQVTKLKRTFAPDLVHIHCVSISAFFSLETAKAYSAPLLVTLTEEKMPQELRPAILQRTLRAAQWVTAKATVVLTQARQLVPEITPRSSVIYNGAKIPPLPPEPLHFETPRVLCLGRLVVAKGFDLAVTAVASLVQRFPTLRLILAGDGPERSALERQVAALGLANVVEFTGWIAPQAVFSLMNTATMVVMPSRWEGLPSVALQAALMARPVVATRAGGLPEIIVHQHTGLLLEKDDSVALADAIAFLLAHPAVATQLGQVARRRAQEIFGWDQCVNAYDRLYKQLIGEQQC
jgi:glycogen(starch) synthase